MEEVKGISMYFRNDRIHIRKGTIEALNNPKYVHFHMNEEQKQLFIARCEKDEDSFRVYYKKSDESEETSPLVCYINAKRILDYFARVVGVRRNSDSLRFKGEVYEEGRIVFIDLSNYEVITHD